MSTVAQVLEPKQQVGLKRILIATDFSNASRVALAYALAMARKFGAEVAVAHAVPLEPREAVPMDPLPHALNRPLLEAEQQMNQLEQEMDFGNVEHEFVVHQGPVWNVLSSTITREQSDILVMGTHGRGALKKLALGSVAEQVLRLASCPVFTIGPKVLPPTEDKVEFKTILFATDFGSAACAAFPYALFLAESCESKLVLLHMVPPITVFDIGPAAYGAATYSSEDYAAWQQRMKEKALEMLRKSVPETAKLAGPLEYVVEVNFLPEGILDTARKYHADLIVMGANRSRSPRLTSHIPWALMHDVLCEATCPVLSVRG